MATAEMAATRAPSQSQILAATVASLLGWGLDLFDLFILLYVAPVLGTLFFPSHSPTLSLASVYASFAITLLMRPVGSGVFGNYADRHGRKAAMVIAVTGVGLVTALLGALPTFPQVGILAPIIFLIVRLAQGVFVGGVVASTHTIGTETLPANWRGLGSGLIGGGGAGIGALIASIAFAVWSGVFPGPAFAEWGWRFMFFTGILSTLLGLFVFRTLEESPLWAQKKKQEGVQKSPLGTLLKSEHRNTLLVNLLIVAGGGTAYYLTSGYLPTFLNVVLKVPPATTSPILIVSSALIIFAAMFFGQLSQWIGRKTAFLVIGVIDLIVIPLGYLQFGATPASNLGAVWFWAMVLTICGNAAYAPVMVFLNERFPTAIRASGTGLSWNIGFAIGGMMPTFVTGSAASVADIPGRLAVFVGVLMLIYLAGSMVVPETKGKLQ